MEPSLIQKYGIQVLKNTQLCGLLETSVPEISSIMQLEFFVVVV